MTRHLKRLRIPSFWKAEKKTAKWAVRPMPGAHKQFESIPLVIILRDVLKLVDTEKDAKSIIKMGGVIVDGVIRKDQKYSAGLMDVVSITKFNLNYRIVPTPKGLELLEIDAKESNRKFCMIRGKTTVSGGKLQLNLHDGRNILADPKGGYSTGDTIVVELPSQKIIGHVKLEKGALVIISKGKNIGMLGKITDIIVSESKEPTKVICNVNGEKLEVIKDYVFVVGKDKPLIKVE